MTLVKFRYVIGIYGIVQGLHVPYPYNFLSLQNKFGIRHKYPCHELRVYPRSNGIINSRHDVFNLWEVLYKPLYIIHRIYIYEK